MDITLDGQQAPETDMPTFAIDTSVGIDEVDERIAMSFECGRVQTSGGDQAVRQQMGRVLSGMEGTSARSR